ncbi:aliphatic sulfonate ABC transporter substrate-binding protein [Agrobacterium sp. SHOUNA12C]|uniref:Putative aliphatic sulfonates-binding protein n=2 Tax=Rhizobium rhizogenes TaxID=359 RepID=B9JG08_RHIR8|nr:aliphatic sulfonate ABC transporter substrate-binding protein [Rhizobium rhizogenes]ACM26848.1 aliphatic sulfonate substrate binding component of ABC transporter [Rhizobium rhizogenes K84]KAA6489846.1 aliphatic sulfonate ABC transporter substrate-binding protein [Agrobacterium sp. ICMP 7243]MCJ9724334.1 aliphatic sulfonate ABC transporter substrate-binding protein [Agrobacterium sp. BETTINA12B]MCJ9761065.1 aliphatic sulfonate ABC transporter substrate-binding protein [Agrobacterium sp. SHOUN
MISRRQTLSLLGATAATLALPSIRSARAAAATTFRIGWQKNGVLALAKRKGSLEKLLAGRGISVEWSEFTSGPPLLEALGAGALDFGATGDVPPLFAQAANGNLLYVGQYSGSPEGSAILVRKDSPIQTLADLKGKKLAFKRGSSAHNVAVKALRKGGLTVDDVQALDLAPPDASAAFKTGAIDAWSIWDPYLAIAEADPDTRILTTARGLLDSYSYFLGNADFTKDNPQVIVDVLEELAKVGTAAQANLDDTVAALSEITGVPANITRVTLTRPDFNLGAVSTINDAAIAYQQGLADAFYDLGIVPKKLTITDIVWRPKAS